MSISSRLGELGLQIPPEPETHLAPAFIVGSLLVTSGRTSPQRGKVPSVLAADEAPLAARDATLRALGAVCAEAGSLDRVERVLRVEGFVNCEADFTATSAVLDGASDLIYALFGREAGRHTRIAVGASALPSGASVEVVLTVALRS